MCCDDGDVLDLPAEVIEMLVRYRRMRDEQGWGWGEQALPDFFRWSRFSRLGTAWDEFAASGDWGAAVRAAIGDGDPPAGVVVVTVGSDGTLACRVGRLRPAVAGTPVAVDVLLESRAEDDVTVEVGGVGVPVPAGGRGCARWTSTPLTPPSPWCSATSAPP